MPNQIVAWFMARFFKLLYNQFAWLYDFAAWVVSFGQWKDWVSTLIELVEPVPTLELGFGPGHLQHFLLLRGFPAFGLDLSQNMTRIANQRIKTHGSTPRLIQASGLKIPLPDNSFEQVISTFPSAYIFQEETIGEIARVLSTDGKLIILLMVNFVGKSIPHRALSLIYRLSGQTMTIDEQAKQNIITPFQIHGLMPFVQTIRHDSTNLIFLIANKV